MSYQYMLPKDKKQREEVTAKLLLEGRDQRRDQKIKWWVNRYYMEGIREFSKIDYTTGTVSVNYANDAGILRFRYEDIVSKYQAQLGRLLALDLRPAVRKKGVSLDGMRKASVAQVVLDAAFPEDKINKLKLDMCPPLLMYGTIGVGVWINGPQEQGLEVMMPWEIFPIPTGIINPSEKRGMMRVRYVPVDWVKNLVLSPGKNAKAYRQADSIKMASGDMPQTLDLTGDGLTTSSLASGAFFIHSASSEESGQMAFGKKNKKDEKQVDITQLIEIWTETSEGYLAEYSVSIGISKIKELFHADHTESKYHMPVGVIRDVTVGGFYGRSFVDLQIPLNHEIELALASLFESVSDFDLYGLELWPTTLGTNPEAERGQDGIKRIRFEPDYTSPDLKPEHIMPAKLTAPQFQAVKLGTELMDKLANQPTEMLGGGAPGRVDSSAGLGMLYEISNVPLTPTAKNIAEGLSGRYRAMLRLLKDKWSDQDVVSISNLDDSLAGIILNAEQGTMTLSQNAIPYPDEVSITIASEVPVSKEQQKQELKEAFKDQRITLDEFNREVRKRGLDIPVGDEVGWQNYRRAMLENIMLFGDGRKAGKITVSPHDLHRIHVEVLEAFMARPEFYLASAEVIEKFEQHINEHRGMMGTFPDQMPYPEDQAEAMLGQGGMPGMPGMPGQPQF